MVACVSLSCALGCGALQTLPFSAADPGSSRSCGSHSTEPGGAWGQGAKHVEERGGNSSEELGGQAEEIQFLYLPTDSFYTSLFLPHKVDTDKSNDDIYGR